MRRARTTEVPCGICGGALGALQLDQGLDWHPYCAEVWSRAALGSTPLTEREWAEMQAGRRRVTPTISQVRSSTRPKREPQERLWWSQREPVDPKYHSPAFGRKAG